MSKLINPSVYGHSAGVRYGAERGAQEQEQEHVSLPGPRLIRVISAT